MFKRYRKKPVVIKAVQLTADNMLDVLNCFCDVHKAMISLQPYESPILEISTLEGDIKAFVGDWLIVGVEGELYPCKDSIFRATYELE